jgi:hypothetical protein
VLRIIGFIFFFLGIIATLISAAKLPAPGYQWSDMLFYYLIAIVPALIGLLLLYWLPEKEKEQQRRLLDKKGFHLIELLQGLVMEMRQLSQEINTLDSDTIADRIDQLLDHYVVPFTQARQQIFFQLGRSQGAEIIMMAANGERLLNRVWSAVSDGNLQEAYLTYPKALMAFEQTYYQYQKHEDS